MNRMEAETHVQKSIRHCLSMLAPFQSTDAEKQIGQQQFYQFMSDIYRQMYEKPEKYFVFAKPYEDYLLKLKDKPQRKAKEKEHANDSRESVLRNTFQQAIQFYARFFYELGLAGEELDESTGALKLSMDAYENVLKSMNSIHASQYNEDRYRLLAKLGICIQEKEKIIYIRHLNYDKAMYGVQFLCKAPQSKYKYMNYLRLDYKNAYKAAPAVEDILLTLPSGSAAVVQELEESLTELVIKEKIRPLRGIVSDFRWKVEYSYKGKNICGFYADNEYLMLCIYFNDFQNINRFAKELQDEDTILFNWFRKQLPERLCKCPSNRRVLLGEEYRRICGLSNRTETVNPSEEDVKRAMQVLKKFRGIK